MVDPAGSGELRAKPQLEVDHFLRRVGGKDVEMVPVSAQPPKIEPGIDRRLGVELEDIHGAIDATTLGGLHTFVGRED